LIPFVGGRPSSKSFGSVSGSWIIPEIVDGKWLKGGFLCGYFWSSRFAMKEELYVFE
jgi:hypothetical protein